MLARLYIKTVNMFQNRCPSIDKNCKNILKKGVGPYIKTAIVFQNDSPSIYKNCKYVSKMTVYS